MKRSDTITIKMSEVRERINALLDIEERSAEEQTELEAKTAEIQRLEPELRAAVAAEPDPQTTVTNTTDPETRERLELRGRASFGRMLFGLLRGVSIADGPEAEYRAALGVNDDGLIPIDLFEQDRPAPETRAVTPSPGSGEGVTVAPVQPFVFSPSIAPRLGIDMPSVGSGGYTEMTIGTALTPMPEGKGDAADGTAAALVAVTAAPRRISARLSLAVEDVAAVGQANFESALRAHTSMALSHALDDQVISGNGTSPNIEGLVSQLTDPTDPTAIVDFDAYVAAFADAVDGLWASKPSEVGIVANVDAYKLSAKTFRDGTGGQSRAGEVAFSDYARAHYGGWWTNSRMPATASTIARGIVHRMGRMGMRTACLPTWGTLSVDDIYTDSAKGERHFTVHTLVGSKVLLVQPAAYSLAEFKVA